jgi:uncharacterized membrane protein (UPF0127 family)
VVAVARALAFAVLMMAAVGARAESALETLVIQSGGKSHSFQVEVMRTDAERAKGLMFRRYMPADRGMLFDFKTPGPAAMWMKDTYLPLDMVFIRANGTIARVEENTEPMSTRTIPSGEAVVGVLELNAGTAARLDIKAGDKVTHPLFGK